MLDACMVTMKVVYVDASRHEIHADFCRRVPNRQPWIIASRVILIVRGNISLLWVVSCGTGIRFSALPF